MKPTKFLISSIAIVASFATLALAQPSGGVAERFKPLDSSGDGKPGPGDQTRTITVGDLQRRYRVHVPKKYAAAHPTPVIVVLRGFKGQLLEGGIRVPFLAQWKAKLPAGRTNTQAVMAFDIHATALVAAGGKLPTDRPLDGVDLMPFLLGEKSGTPHERLFWRAGQQKAARAGDWKFVDTRTGAPMLFNLKDDIGEQHDLATQNSAKLKELQAAYDAWAKEMQPAQWVRQDNRTPSTGKATAQGVPRGGGIEARFQQFDRNKDGKLTPTEFPREDIFKQMDKNADGVVTPDEARIFYGGRRQQKANEN